MPQSTELAYRLKQAGFPIADDILDEKELSLEWEDLYDKIVTRGQGGYCFEVNGAISYMLKKLGFEMTDSMANFIFAKHETISGIDIYSKLRENGILVRHFTDEKIKDYNRITIGSEEEMAVFVDTMKKIVKGA